VESGGRWPFELLSSHRPEQSNVQSLVLSLSSTYTRYEIRQPAWFLPWLSSIGGALTVTLFALKTLLAVLYALQRRCGGGRSLPALGDEAPPSGSCGSSRLHGSIECALQHAWRPVEAMEKIARGTKRCNLIGWK